MTPAPFVRPDVAAFLSFLNALPGPRTHQLPPDAARQQMRAMRAIADVDPVPMAVRRDLAIPGPAGAIAARLYDVRANRDAAGPVCVFFHGGGFVIGDIDTHEPFCTEAARVLDVPVVSIDYRLAPEAPWPAAPDDCEAAARWIADTPDAAGITATGLILMGDSAGGNLAIVTAMALRDRPARVPVVLQVPIYPAVDDGEHWPSLAAFAEGHLLTADTMRYFTGHYGGESGHARAAPLGHAHHDMPPTLVVTASLDPLRDQGRAYAGALIAAGVPVTFREATGTIHGFIQFRKAIPSAQGDVAMLLDAARAMIAEPAPQR